MGNEVQKNRIMRWPYLIYGFMILLFLGLIYAWSVFIAPLEAQFGWLRSQTSLIFTLSMSFFCIGGIVSGFLIRKMTIRKTLYLAAAFVLTGFIASTRIQTLSGIYITYGVITGLGVGLGYNATLSMFSRWYPDKPGLCSGSLLMGFGFGGLLLGTLATYLMEIIKWQGIFILFGSITALLLVLCTHIISENPPESILAIRKNTKKKSDWGDDFVHQEMLKRPSFRLFFFWALCLCASGLAIIGNAVPIVKETGAKTALATTVAGLISVTNGLSRIIFGTIFDVIGRLKTMLIDSAVSVLAIMILIVALSFDNILLLVLGFILTGLGYGGVPTISSSYANRMYGPKNYPINFSIINSNIIPAAMLGPTLAGMAQTVTNSYLPSFYILLALCILTGVFALLIKKP